MEDVFFKKNNNNQEWMGYLTGHTGTEMVKKSDIVGQRGYFAGFTLTHHPRLWFNMMVITRGRILPLCVSVTS